MSIFKQIVSFIFLAAIQVLVLNHILFAGYLNPYIYIIFILYLPVKTPRAYVLLLAFALGMIIDLFENSGGVHIAATVLLAFLRLPFLRIATRKQGADFEDLKVQKIDLPNMLIYAILGTFTHHFTLFMIESYSITQLGTVLARTGISSAFTLVFIMMWQLWSVRKTD